MKIHNIMMSMLVLSMTALPACITAQEKPQEITARIISKYNNPVQLHIEISCNKPEVSLTDIVEFSVKIFNFPINGKKEDISLFNPLKLGTDGGLTITVVSSKESEVFPKKKTDNQSAQPVIDGSWPYFTLLTYHHIGAIYEDSARNIFQNPGKYYVFAEYLSPATEADIKKYGDPQNFWGREVGPIRSAPLEINVTR